MVCSLETKIDQLIAGGRPDLNGMPLAVVDAIIEAASAASIHLPIFVVDGWG
jgi:hypothetical protein